MSDAPRPQVVQEFVYESSRAHLGVDPHVVWVYDNGKVSCSCRGFSTPSKCWHVKDVAKKLGRVLDISTWGASLGPEITHGT